MTLIRYPGSKDKVAKHLMTYFSSLVLPLFRNGSGCCEYREPLFGAGAVGFRILDNLPRGSSAWLNDIDPGMVALWHAVHKTPKQLIERVQNFIPTAGAFYRFKERDGTVGGVEGGFEKLALHRISHSGLGAKAGGPQGGKHQDNSEYKVGCRWRPQMICKEIWRLHGILGECGSVKITCCDFEEVIASAGDGCFVYCDPPYYEKGPQLYKHSMTHDDHVRLADVLNKSDSNWVLSYDDHPAIRSLYQNAEFSDLFFTYSIASTSGLRQKNREVVITPREHARC